MKNADPKVLTVWRIRLVAAMLVPSFFTSLLFRGIPVLWNFFTGLWVVVAVGAYFVYLPIKYKKHTYGIIEGSLVVTGGVVYTRVRSVPLENVQFVTVTASILQNIFGVPTLSARAAGGFLVVYGIRADEAGKLQAVLTEEGRGQKR